MNASLDIIPINQWFKKPDGPLIIGGPCSAESEEQVFNTAQELVEKQKIHILRAGIWKPRTRPNAFEGVGGVGLSWLVDAGRKFKIPTITEVANAHHLELALKMGIDMIWIGARTTVSPFSIQEIADALKGVDIPVFVKNPINPDLQLWVGALERFNNAGVKKLAAIHRGFSAYHDSIYRNLPMWNIPIDLKALFPDLDILCDPSHIAGKRELIGVVCQKAMDLNFSGLMIESHIHPEKALSDAEQQLSPLQLQGMLNSLQIRQADCEDINFKSKLEELRELIDEIDFKLIQGLKARKSLVEKIGEYKLENNVTIFQLKRWQEILESRTSLAVSLGMSESFVIHLLKVIHQESIRLQTEILNGAEIEKNKK